MKTRILSISHVSTETGISKELLRKWESRYGFPEPLRDEGDNRLYSLEQIQRLKLIKRLIDDGARPGKVVPLPEEQLKALIEKKRTESSPIVLLDSDLPLLEWLQAKNPTLLRQKLKEDLQKLGVTAFILHRLPALNVFIGEAWVKGLIGIHDEHLYSEIIQSLLRDATAHIQFATAAPRIIITTPPNELHALGNLMLETVLRVEGVDCISLGIQTPINDLAIAAQEFEADIVALSFSSYYPKRRILPLLKDLRLQVPAGIQIWAGGAGVLGLQRSPRGIVIVQHIADALQMIKKQKRKALKALAETRQSLTY